MTSIWNIKSITGPAVGVWSVYWHQDKGGKAVVEFEPYPLFALQEEHEINDEGEAFPHNTSFDGQRVVGFSIKSLPFRANEDRSDFLGYSYTGENDPYTLSPWYEMARARQEDERRDQEVADRLMAKQNLDIINNLPK